MWSKLFPRVKKIKVDDVEKMYNKLNDIKELYESLNSKCEKIIRNQKLLQKNADKKFLNISEKLFLLDKKLSDKLTLDKNIEDFRGKYVKTIPTKDTIESFKDTIESVLKIR